MNSTWHDLKLSLKVTFFILFTWYAFTQMAGAAFGREIKHNDLVGMWGYVSTHNEFPDGRKESYFGKNPIGRFSIRRSGAYSHIIACSPEDKKANACVMDLLVHWGTYEVDRKQGSFTGSVEWASNPGLIGKQQLRVITKLTRNELHYVNHESVAGSDAKVVAVLRRMP